MRWPFHFGNAARADDHASAAQPPAPPRPRDWASLAPIQRAIDDAPLTAPSIEFSRSLAGSNEPPLHLETLGHHRTPDGPRGLVVGIANPIESYAPTTELVDRPRRRSEATVSVQAAPEGLPSAMATGAGSLDALEDDSGPDVLARVLPALAGGGPSAPVAISRLTDAGSVELGALRPVQRTTETASAPAAEAGVAAYGNQPPPAPPAGARLSLGLSRRHGLGAPIRSAGPAAVQRSTPPPEFPPSPAETPAGREPHPVAGAFVSELSLQPAGDEDRAQVAGPEQWLRPLPIARRQGAVGRAEGSESSVSSESIGAAPAAGGMGGQTSPSTQLAPALGAVPVSIQRIVGTEALRPVAQQPRSIPEQRRSTPTVPLTSLRPPLTSVRLPAEPAFVGVPVSHSRSLEMFSEMPQPAVQRSPVIPWGPTGAGAPVVRAFRASDSKPLVWNVQRQMPTESPSEDPIVGATSAGEGPSPGAPMMAAAPAAVPAAGAAPTSGEAEGVPHPSEASSASAGGPGAGVPAAGAAAAPHGEKELYELAQALFHPLMRLFRREVLNERERAGFVTDLR